MDPNNPQQPTPPQQPIQSSIPTFIDNNKNLLFFLVILFIGVIFGVLFSRQPEQNRQTLTIVGNATIEAPADKVVIEAATEATSPDYNKAIENNKKKLDDVKKALRTAGLADSKFKIINSYTDQDYDYTDADSPNPPANLAQLYYAVTSFEITLEEKEVNKADTYIAILTDLSTDPYATYSLKNQRQYQNKLQEDAVLNARKQAESLAKTNKLSIKKVLSIQDRAAQPSSEDEFYQQTNFTSDSKNIKLTASYEVKYELGTGLFSF